MTGAMNTWGALTILTIPGDVGFSQLGNIDGIEWPSEVILVISNKGNSSNS